MARESELWKSLSKARRIFGDALHMERIENFLTGGTPDVEGYLKTPQGRGAFWLELKSTERPKYPFTPVRFALNKRELQIEFMRKRWEIGGNAFFLLQVGSGADRVWYLAPGDLGHLLRDGLTEAALTVECVNTGFYKKPSASKILERVVTCRKLPSLMGR